MTNKPERLVCSTDSRDIECRFIGSVAIHIDIRRSLTVRPLIPIASVLITEGLFGAPLFTHLGGQVHSAVVGSHAVGAILWKVVILGNTRRENPPWKQRRGIGSAYNSYTLSLFTGKEHPRREHRCLA